LLLELRKKTAANCGRGRARNGKQLIREPKDLYICI